MNRFVELSGNTKDTYLLPASGCDATSQAAPGQGDEPPVGCDQYNSAHQDLNDPHQLKLALPIKFLGRDFCMYYSTYAV